MRDKFAVRIGAATAHFGKLRVGEACVVAMRQIVDQRRAGGVLIVLGKLLDLPQSLLKKFGHGVGLPQTSEGGQTRTRAFEYGSRMLLKLIALLSAAIPLILFMRAMMGRRQTKFGSALREAKKQIDLAIYIFIGIVGVIVAFALGKLAWAWWTAG